MPTGFRAGIDQPRPSRYDSITSCRGPRSPEPRRWDSIRTISDAVHDGPAYVASESTSPVASAHPRVRATVTCGCCSKPARRRHASGSTSTPAQSTFARHACGNAPPPTIRSRIGSTRRDRTSHRPNCRSTSCGPHWPRNSSVRCHRESAVQRSSLCAVRCGSRNSLRSVTTSTGSRIAVNSRLPGCLFLAARGGREGRFRRLRRGRRRRSASRLGRLRCRPRGRRTRGAAG
jgi:hypothetical protein